MATAVVACGGSDDSDGSGSAPTGTVRVLAKDNFFDKKTYRATAGEITFEYVERGRVLHDLLIRNVADFKLEVGPQVKTDTGTVTLTPGTYELYCDQPGHEATMNAKLIVA